MKSSQQQSDVFAIDAKQQKSEFYLGRLDGLVSSPNRSSKVRVTDSKKITAILLETNIVELQRHLLTITVQNQVCRELESAGVMGSGGFNLKVYSKKKTFG